MPSRVQPKVAARAGEEKPRFVEPMKCRLVDEPPSGAEWIFELKHDGFRVLVVKDGRTVNLYSRNGKSLNERFSSLLPVLAALPVKSCVLDGEVAVLDQQGRSRFQLLQNAQTESGRASMVFYLFDLLHLNGKWVVQESLVERKRRLAELIQGMPPILQFSKEFNGPAEPLLEKIAELGMEGLIAKKSTSAYEPGLRSGAWVKIKVSLEQEFVIGGYTPPKGARPFFGALLVGYNEGGQLRFASKVGTGFSDALLRTLHGKFQKIRQAESPFVDLKGRVGFPGGGLTGRELSTVTWVQPHYVCQVRFTEWTEDGHLRHPAFLGLRDDKAASEVVRETTHSGE
jgi:bifunctional non-homologous end joining protein LigD